MKRLISLVLFVALATLPLLTGCSGVQMNARYSELLDKTAMLSAPTAATAREGRLTEEQKTQALEAQARTWQLFRDARDGKASQ
jgi:hypothetical protein